MKRLFLIVFCLLLIPSAVMGESSRVLPASYTEYTYDSAGGGEDYTALATWEADTDIDVSTTGQVLTCSAGIHTDSVALGGATTDSNGFRVIRAASGQRGTPTSGVRFDKGSTTQYYVVSVQEQYCSIQDIASKLIYTTTGGAFVFMASSSNVSFISCTAYDSIANSGYIAGFRVNGGTTGVVIINCVATGITGLNSYSAGIYCDSAEIGSLTFYVYNCTVTNCKSGLQVYADLPHGATLNSKNCIIQGNTYNVLAGGSGTKTINQITNVTAGVTFAADGYHLASNDTGAINIGTDLSADDVFAFDDDIDGETRDDWDKGADEYVATATRRRVIIVSE